jgi:multisubunit Na+/H+ antiporter MnhG subunit
MQVAVDIALGLVVAAGWLAAAAFVRMRTAMDRLHCSTFVTVVGGALLFVAVAFQDGATSRTWKTLFLIATSTAISAAGSHAIGRALQLREGAQR